MYWWLSIKLCNCNCVVRYILIDGKLIVEFNNPLNWHWPITVLKQQVLIQREIHSTTKLICLRQDEMAQLDSRCDELTKEISLLISKHQSLQNNLADTQKVLRYGDRLCFGIYLYSTFMNKCSGQFKYGLPINTQYIYLCKYTYMYIIRWHVVHLAEGVLSNSLTFIFSTFQVISHVYRTHL